MAELAQQADGLAPAETLLDQLPFPLTLRVARMPGRAGIERTGRLRRMDIRRDVRRDVQGAEGRDEDGVILALIGPECAATLARRERGQQLDRRFTFGVIARRPYVGGDDESVPVVHQHTGLVAEASRPVVALTR